MYGPSYRVPLSGKVHCHGFVVVVVVADVVVVVVVVADVVVDVVMATQSSDPSCEEVVGPVVVQSSQ